jgi:steroid delta-isomerase-like uncharacterized protein
MGAMENLATHTAWTEAEDQRDLTRHADFIHDDIVVYQAGAREPVIGLDAYLAMMQATYAGLPDFRVVLEDQFATDDRVVCRWSSHGTHSGELFGMPASGRNIEYTGVSLWEFDAGKARRGFIYPDLVSLMSQLRDDGS